jgi:hypothetical protein
MCVKLGGHRLQFSRNGGGDGGHILARRNTWFDAYDDCDISVKDVSATPLSCATHGSRDVVYAFTTFLARGAAYTAQPRSQHSPRTVGCLAIKDTCARGTTLDCHCDSFLSSFTTQIGHIFQSGAATYPR